MSVFDNILNDDGKVYTGLSEELKAIKIYNTFKKLNKSITFVANSLYEANMMYQYLLNYTDKVLLFPMDDFLASEALAISPDLKITRIETIKLLNEGEYIVVTNLMGYLRYLPDKKEFEKRKINLEKGKEYDIKKLEKELYNLGYVRETLVNKTGDFAVRGYVIDIFPLFYEKPIRIEFWGDEIDTIKEFNVDNQLTTKPVDKLEIYPITEFLVDKDVDQFEVPYRDIYKYTDVKSISTFTNNIVIFNDYEQLKNSCENLATEMYNYTVSSELPSDTKYMNDFLEIKIDKEIDFPKFDKKDSEDIDIDNIDKLGFTVENLKDKLKVLSKKYKNIIICASNRITANKLIDLLGETNVILTSEDNIYNDRVNLIIKKINKGFIYEGVLFISDNDIYGNSEIHQYKTRFKLGTKIKDLNKLNPGDYVVHSLYGIGIYRGLATLEKNGLKKDYLLIEYRDGDKLYIPVEKIEMISKYSSKEGYVPKINKLGSNEWEKTKYRARKKIEDIAGELLKLYALRESTKGYAFPKDDELQLSFEKEFKYDETLDQIKVVEEIKKDMENSHPMDRLLCGDVGYGKTEVAFRAIFKAILGGKQAAILCPTTILSSQHFHNAIERFKNYDINIELLNRFVPLKKQKEVLKRLESGSVDLLIGTHRILGDDVKFKDLGLLVVDEEQRFGVKNKEKIKQYKNNIDVLTLSATPIPRTLQMSISGLRSLSLIETPPVDRYPVQTYVIAENKSIIRDAVYKELSRKGQCFILCNNIDMLDSKRIELEELVPDARIGIAHGKMSKTELEDVMQDFEDKKFDVLLCTTIIETGIDIPNVNTLIIYDAENFGLSQLYQIRGRVGRTNKIAYCYLMYNKKKVLSEIAVKRLEAIKEFTELGSGFAIAMRDLSIRGAGDILGSEQAGFVDTIGIELYMEMLNNEINRLKGIPVEEEEEFTKPIIEVATAISDNYVSDEEVKIEIHKKINEIDSLDKLESVKKELEDRFGKMDEDLIIYMYEEWLEKLSTKLDIKNIRQTKNSIEIMIPEVIVKKLNVQDLFYDVVNLSRMFRFGMRGKNLIITLDTVKLEKHFIYYLIDLYNLIEKNFKD